MNENNRNILVSLDALYDTPLQVYKEHYDSDVLTKVLKNWGDPNRYLIWDKSYGVPMEEYLDHWNNRGNELLHPSEGVTPIDTTSVLDIINISIDTHDYEIDRNEIAIMVNQYPFTLTEKEQDVLSRVITNTTGIKVIFKNIPKLDITPGYLNSLSVGSWFDIDVDQWIGNKISKIAPLETWTDSMVCPEIHLYSPKIFNIEDGATPNVKSKMILKGKSIWEVRTQTFKPLIDLDYLPTVHFTSTKAVKTLEIINAINE